MYYNMANYPRDAAKAISLKHLVFISILTFTLINFSLSLQDKNIDLLFEEYLKASILIFSVIAILVLALIAIASYFHTSKYNLNYASIILLPLVILPLWNPQTSHFNVSLALILVLATQICFFLILTRPDYPAVIKADREKIFLAGLIILYFAFFTYIGIRQFNSFSFFNSKDFGVFNQTFWNTIHGRLFSNSTYGSHFASHNSLFFLLLMPFYYVFPHPLTLFILKNLIFTLAVIPFYLIARNTLKSIAAMPLVLTFMFYPFLATQNLKPPFEILYAPFFILFAYFFYQENKFAYFLLFMVLSLTIKEQVSLVAVAFGLYAFFDKKSLKWAIAPIVLGIAWGIFSLLVLSTAQKLYHPHSDSIWYLTTLKSRFFDSGSNILNSIIAGLRSSNLGRGYIAKPALEMFFLPLGLVPALLSPVVLLGLPELILNLLYDRSAMLSPSFHYNILVSCFLFIATAEGIKRIADFKWIGKIGIGTNTAKLLISIFILCCTLMYSPLWIQTIGGYKDPSYIQTVREALSYIPKDAFVTVPHNLAAQVSSRKRYSLIREGQPGDYILIDPTIDPSFIQNLPTNTYKKIFAKNGVMVFKKPGVP